MPYTNWNEIICIMGEISLPERSTSAVMISLKNRSVFGVLEKSFVIYKMGFMIYSEVRFNIYKFKNIFWTANGCYQ